MLLVVVLVFAIVAILVALAALGRRYRRLGWMPPDDLEHKLELLRRFQGWQVTLGVGIKNFFRDTGNLSIQSDDAVILDHPKSGRRRIIRLSDIRSITDPETGEQVGGPW